MTQPQQDQPHAPYAPPYAPQQPYPTQQWPQVPPQWTPPSAAAAAPPSPPASRRRIWPWAVGGVVLLFLVAGISGGQGARDEDRSATTPAPALAAPSAPAVAPTTPAPAPVIDVVLPQVAGQNGAIVFDQLQKLGLTNVSYASRDKDDKFVLYVANWTAVKIEPKAGTTVKSDQPVVVTMTKER